MYIIILYTKTIESFTLFLIRYNVVFALYVYLNKTKSYNLNDDGGKEYTKVNCI